LTAAPSTLSFIETINNHILTGEMYKAIKGAKKLVAYETELMENAKRGASLRDDCQTRRQSA
jgi:flagellar protein FlbT